MAAFKEIRITHEILIGKLDGKRPHSRPRHAHEDKV
jgi:hypothetical protein